MNNSGFMIRRNVIIWKTMMLAVKDDPSKIPEHDDIVWAVDHNNNSPNREGEKNTETT